MEEVMLRALAATTITKVVVDAAALGWGESMPSWTKPVLAIAGGMAVVALLFLADGLALTQQTGAQAALAGILAGGAAVGVTTLSRHAETATHHHPHG